MEPAALAFREILAEVEISDGNIPVVNNVDAKQTTDKAEISDKLIKQIYSQYYGKISSKN